MDFNNKVEMSSYIKIKIEGIPWISTNMYFTYFLKMLMNGKEKLLNYQSQNKNKIEVVGVLRSQGSYIF